LDFTRNRHNSLSTLDKQNKLFQKFIQSIRKIRF